METKKTWFLKYVRRVEFLSYVNFSDADFSLKRIIPMVSVDSVHLFIWHAGL